MSDIDDRIDLGNALRVVGKQQKPPMATCPLDDEPLVFTFEFRGAEFVCMVCGRKYGYMAPKPAKDTPELRARLEELEAQYERAARREAGSA